MAAKKKIVEGITPLDQIQSYLNDHKDSFQGLQYLQQHALQVVLLSLIHI